MPTKRFKAPTDQQRKLAEGIFKQGKSFKDAALDAGYSPNVAKLGPSYLRKHSVGVNVAFIEASKQLTWSPSEVKAIIRARLLVDITNGKSSGVERACELLGKDKEVDMWARSGDVQIGIFGSLDASIKELDVDPDEE
jgi:hypothetical protein